MAPLPSSIAVIFGGPSPEHDVSVLTGLQATRALQGITRTSSVHAIYWSKAGEFLEVDASLEASAFASGTPAGARVLQLSVGAGGGFAERRSRLGRSAALEIDAALICCHGGPGENGSLQAVLDLAGVPYSGPSAKGAALGMDKFATGAVLASGGIAVLNRIVIDLDSEKDEPTFAGPYIVKPRYGGSSIGIEVVADYATAIALAKTSVHLASGAVLEPYRADLFDLQIALRTYPNLELSAIERPIRSAVGAQFLNYADKYVGGQGMDAAARELPAQISDRLAEHLRATARHASALLGCRGVNRLDFLSDGEQLYANEINTIPGSLSRHLFVEPALGFGQLLTDLLAEAVERPAASYSSAGADGAVLRDAKSIASKLA